MGWNHQLDDNDDCNEDVLLKCRCQAAVLYCFENPVFTTNQTFWEKKGNFKDQAFC